MLAVHKVTLATGKVVLICEPKMRHMKLAEKLANGNMTGLVFQEELLKQLIQKVDEQEIKKPDLLDLDELFSLAEIMQLYSFLGKLLGGGTIQETQSELIFGKQ
jgi:hypothetical protein